MNARFVLRAVARALRILPVLGAMRRRYRKSRKRVRRFLQDDPITSSLIQYRQRRRLKAVEVSRGATVWFIVIAYETWKYWEVYDAFKTDKRFVTRVSVFPSGWNGDHAARVAEETTARLRQSGIEAETWSHDEQEPNKGDIVFLLNPHESLYPAGYVNKWLKDCIVVYVPYAFWLALDYEELVFRTKVHRSAALVLYESDEHLRLAKSRGRYAKNGVSIGYAGFAEMTPQGGPGGGEKSEDLEDSKAPRILWAPHHSIEANGFSDFMYWHEHLLDTAKNNLPYLLVFRPHPVLRPKLEEAWGHKRARAYYDEWHRAKCGLLDNDSVNVSFHRSSAMMHDSLSFLAEYVITRKPAAYLCRNPELIRERLNGIGKELLDLHVAVSNANQLEAWVVSVLQGKSPKRATLTDQKREQIFGRAGSDMGTRLVDLLTQQ